MSYFPTIPDETAFTAGASPVTPIAGVFDDSLSAVTSGESGSLRITEKRAAHVNLRSETGTELATSAAPLRVDPTGTTKQPVTLFDSAGTAIVLSSGRLLVDGSGVTQPISAVSLPLPTGASTSAKQPAIGTAGTPSADVISVQGVSGGTAQPISGTVADSTLAAIISGGKAAVTDAAAEASLATLAGAVSAAKFQAEEYVMTTGGVLNPRQRANLISLSVLSTTTPVVAITGAPGYFVQGISVSLDAAATIASAGTLSISITDSSSSFLFIPRFHVVGTAAPPAVNTECPLTETPPDFYWNNKVANSTLSLTLSAALTAGNAVVVINYGLCSFVG